VLDHTRARHAVALFHHFLHRVDDGIHLCVFIQLDISELVDVIRISGGFGYKIRNKGLGDPVLPGNIFEHDFIQDDFHEDALAFFDTNLRQPSFLVLSRWSVFTMTEVRLF
jgi:hypothetical protein